MSSRKYLQISESPSTPALLLHLIERRTRVSIGLWSIVPLIVPWEENSYLRLEERRSPGTRGGGDATCGGQIYSGQLYGQDRYGSARLQQLDLASRHTYGSRVQPKLARSRRPTNEAMDIRKKDWMGVTKGSDSLPPPSMDAGCTFPADELASGCRTRDEV